MTEIVYAAAKTVWDWLPDWITNALTFLKDLALSVGKTLISFFKDPIGTLQSGWNWIVEGITSFLSQVHAAVMGVATAVWNALPDWVQNGLIWLTQMAVNAGLGFLSFIKDPIGTLQSGWNWMVDNVGQMVRNHISGLTSFLGEVLAKIMGTIGEALSGFIDWVLKGLTWLAQMIIGAVQAVVSAVGKFVGSLFNMFINGLTKAMTAGSPDTETEQAVNSMVGTAWTRQMEIIEEAYKSPPDPAGIETAGMAVVGTLLSASVVALAGGAAAELAHPIKQIFAHRTVREILWMVGIPAVMASVITLPSAVGLLTPLRYALQEKFQPNIPTPADMVRFELREVFRDAMRKQQLIPPPSGTFVSTMAKLGYNKFWAESYWAAHWVLPSITQLNEMLHRNIIDRDTWAAFVRRNDYLPAMIPQLEQIIYSPYTRVDIRRMYDVRVLNEAEMVGAYMDIGYDSERATNLALFSKIYIALPDLKARYRNGWISSAELLQEIVDIGVPEDRAIEIMETILKAEGPDRVAAERDLTKSEIIKGAKAEILGIGQAVALLMDLGYDEWEALYILAINKIVEAGHPEGYFQMKQAVELYRASQGLDYQDIPDELIEMEHKIRAVRQELDKLKTMKASENIIASKAVELGALEKEMRSFLIRHSLRWR